MRKKAFFYDAVNDFLMIFFFFFFSFRFLTYIFFDYLYKKLFVYFCCLLLSFATSFLLMICLMIFCFLSVFVSCFQHFFSFFFFFICVRAFLYHWKFHATTSYDHHLIIISLHLLFLSLLLLLLHGPFYPLLSYISFTVQN